MCIVLGIWVSAGNKAEYKEYKGFQGRSDVNQVIQGGGQGGRGVAGVPKRVAGGGYRELQVEKAVEGVDKIGKVRN